MLSIGGTITLFLAFAATVAGASFPRAIDPESLRTSNATALTSGSPHEPTLKVRLLTALSTYTAKPGTPFTSVVIEPFEQEERIVIPRGSLILGAVGKSVRVGFGVIHERASLTLRFERYELPDGREYPLEATLAEIDNAREHLGPDGTIRGILAARNPNSLINGFWYRPDASLVYRSLIGLTGSADQIVSKFDMGPIGAAAFLAFHCAMIRFPDPEIRLAPGTDMDLRAKVRFKDVPSFAPEVPPAVPIDLAEFVAKQPRNLTRADLKPASDIINVVFLGSRHELTEAFLNAGWSTTDHSSIRTFSKVYTSFSAMQTYKSAPVSRMLYQGELPEMVFQKSLNTVSKRHHVRIWHAGTYEGRDVWLGAATHDTGVRFHASAIEFQHKIDLEIDSERSKIVDDLSFAGCTPPGGYVSYETGPPKSAGNDIVTDNRAAVMSIRTCTDDQDYPGLAGMKGSGSWLMKISRRLILETRNYLLREQPYYWGYQIARTSHKHWAHPTGLASQAPAFVPAPTQVAKPESEVAAVN